MVTQMNILDQLDEAESVVSKYLKHPDDEDDIEAITEQVEFITDHARALIDVARAADELADFGLVYSDDEEKAATGKLIQALNKLRGEEK